MPRLSCQPEILDDRLQRAAVEARGAAQFDDEPTAGPHVLAQLMDDSTLADTWLAADHGELASAIRSGLPTTHEQPHLGVPAHERRQTAAPNRFQATTRRTLIQYLIDLHRLSQAFQGWRA